MTSGDCFKVAANLAFAMADQPEVIDVVVAHGLPIGRGPENTGKRYWHAWVEVKVEGQSWAVLDFSSGQRLGMKRSRYYRLGKIVGEHVWRYSVEEARAEILRVETWGPWVDDYEALDETVTA